ncbi:AAA family ATPase [Kocuria rhizophila]|nr:AAA family ATPase [Kocuria rhizophila]
MPQLLTEIDGVERLDVMVVVATNREDIDRPAVLRPAAWT